MNKDYTHLAFIIDRSGSMGSCWTDVTGGYAQLVKDQKSLPGKCTVTVAAFDSEYALLEDFTDIQYVKEELSVAPRGSTALLDAIGKTIVSVGEKLQALPEDERPEKTMVTIQTDGQENASKEWTKARIFDLIKEQREKYSWIFQFLGANEQSISDAVSYGIPASSTALYSTSKTGDTVQLVSLKMKGTRSANDANEALKVSEWTEQERESMKS